MKEEEEIGSSERKARVRRTTRIKKNNRRWLTVARMEDLEFDRKNKGKRHDEGIKEEG